MRIFPLFLIITLMLSWSCRKKADTYYPVRGVWLTGAASDVLFSEAGIREAVQLCSDYGINTIFVVVWSRGFTQYSSEVMKNRFGIAIDPRFEGTDPLQTVISAAHEKGIKVMAWFEYGFATSYQDSTGGLILQKYPEWAAIDTSGQIVTKNGFQWMNPLHPDVQNFMLSLVREVVTKYDVDGIQGDDRLPAMPVEAGYDASTKEAYRRDEGHDPTKNFRDTTWINWRANELNAFMERLYREVKSINEAMIVSMAPSIYPWSKEQYLQDWPSWVKNGWVDIICPQIYRYDIEKYRFELEKIVLEQVSPDQYNKVFPGVLLKVGDYTVSETLLDSMIAENRKHHINGEVFFFYEGLKGYGNFFERLYRVADEER